MLFRFLYKYLFFPFFTLALTISPSFFSHTADPVLRLSYDSSSSCVSPSPHLLLLPHFLTSLLHLWRQRGEGDRLGFADWSGKTTPSTRALCPRKMCDISLVHYPTQEHLWVHVCVPMCVFESVSIYSCWVFWVCAVYSCLTFGIIVRQSYINWRCGVPSVWCIEESHTQVYSVKEYGTITGGNQPGSIRIIANANFKHTQIVIIKFEYTKSFAQLWERQDRKWEQVKEKVGGVTLTMEALPADRLREGPGDRHCLMEETETRWKAHK